MRELWLEAARGRRHELQIMTFEQLPARLAGGLAQPVDDDALRETITAVRPGTTLSKVDGIQGLHGMAGAAEDTLRKAWRAGVELQALVGHNRRMHLRWPIRDHWTVFADPMRS